MISVSDKFKTWMEKQTLNLLRKFTYDGDDEAERVEGFGSINRASDSIVSGGTSLALINTDKHWNKFISDKTNLRRTAKLQLGIEYEPGDDERIDVLTGWGDDSEFREALVNLPIRDKFAGFLEKELGSKEDPLDYYSTSYNPADLAWDILTTHGGLDSTASSANTDIDYTTWSAWKTACTTADLSLEARFTGETIKEALELIRDLTNSNIHQAGNGKIKFFRFTQSAPPAESYLFNEDRFTNFSVKLDSEKIINYLTTYYDREVITNIVTNGDMELENSWPDKGDYVATNLRSVEQVYRGTYSRKIAASTQPHEGAYQDITTIIGREYKLSGKVYVSQGSARLSVGTNKQWFGHSHGATPFTLVANMLTTFEVTSGVAGKLDSIFLRVNNPAGTAHMRCALYDGGGASSNLIAVTQELTIGPGESGWFEFPFWGSPTVEASTTYHLAVWTDDTVTIYYASGSPGNYRWDALAYNSYPDPVTYDSNASGRLFSIYARYSDALFNVSPMTNLAEWVELSVIFTAIGTTTRINLENVALAPDASSTFYVDDVKVEWTGPEFFNGSYLKEDATSQSNYGKVPQTIDGPIVWHATLASATSYADRRVQIFKDPLQVVSFTSFMMGMITEAGDIIRITNPFFGYTTSYFRVHKITALDLANASISFEAADFKDVAGYTFKTPSLHDKSSEAEGSSIVNTTQDWSMQLSSGDQTRAAQRITLSGDTLQQVSFYLKKNQSPTGTVYARVRKVSDDSIIETSSTTLDISTLSTDPAWYDFPFTCAPNEEVRICIEYDGGDSNNYLGYYLSTSSHISGWQEFYYDGTWQTWGAENYNYDMTIKISFIGLPATNTVDDNVATLWQPNPPNEAGAWISWDMGSVKYIKGCRIYWGSDAAYRPSEYKIWVSVDGIEWTEVTHETEAAPASAWKTYSWDFQVVRYFKLTIITHGASGTQVFETDEYSIL